MSLEEESPYSFDDVTPQPLDALPVCNIMYSDEYRAEVGTLLALMNRHEISERALWLTEQVLDQLALHYLVWIYRFDLVKGLNKLIVDELEWCEQIALDNEKNYQIWNYRQLLIEHATKDGGEFSAKRELPLISAMLDADCKNHHVWLYRWWLVRRFKLDTPEELEWVLSMLAQDLRNNLAWSHRYLVVFSMGGAISDDVVRREIDYTEKAIAQCPQNPLSWNYLRGIYRKYGAQCSLRPLHQLADGYRDVLLPALEVLAEHDPSYYLRLAEVDPIRRHYWAALSQPC